MAYCSMRCVNALVPTHGNFYFVHMYYLYTLCTCYVHIHGRSNDKPDTRNACLLARAQPGMPAGVPARHVRRGGRSACSLGRSLAERRGGARQGGVGEGGITASQARWHADDNQVLHGPSKWCVRLRKRDGMICTRHACKGCARHGPVRHAPQARRHQMKYAGPRKRDGMRCTCQACKVGAVPSGSLSRLPTSPHSDLRKGFRRRRGGGWGGWLVGGISTRPATTPRVPLRLAS